MLVQGFIKNEGEEVPFKLQKAVPQGSTITFEHAFKLVGESHGFKQNMTFLRWLRETYFPESFWGFYKEDGTQINMGKSRSAALAREGKGAGKVINRKVYDGKGEGITADLIISRPFEQAKVLIEKCTDKAVLKKALTLSKHFSQKEEYMRAIMRRMEQVY